ncbi:MAG TPA: hypothetical protein VGK71_01180 [Nitrospirota bacterium]
MRIVALIIALLVAAPIVAWGIAGDPVGCYVVPCPIPLAGRNPDQGCYISPCPLDGYSVKPLENHSI